MLRAILFGLSVWAVVSVPVALFVGRLIAIGAEGDSLRMAPVVEDHNGRLHRRAA